MGLAATTTCGRWHGLEGLRFNMKQRLWTLSFVLTLLKTWLGLFHGGADGGGTLGTQGQISTRMNLATHNLLREGL